MEGDGMVAVVQGLQDAGLAVTLMNSAYLRQCLKQNCKCSTEPSTVERAAQIHDGHYTSSYQMAHCNARPSSPPRFLPEFPPQRPATSRHQSNFNVGGHDTGQYIHPMYAYSSSGQAYRRMWERGSASRFSGPVDSCQSTDPFVHSLRRYPLPLSPERSVSTELVQRLLNFTQNKHLSKNSKTRSLRSLREERPTKDKKTDTTSSKNIQTYTRTKTESKDSGANTSNDIKFNLAKKGRRFSTTSPYNMRNKRSYPDDTYDYLKGSRRFLRHPEVRYLNDIRKCIRDSIKQLYEDKSPVCPRIQSRYSEHQRLHHSNASEHTVCPRIQSRYSEHQRLHHPKSSKNTHTDQNSEETQASTSAAVIARCQPPLEVCPRIQSRYSKHQRLRHSNASEHTCTEQICKENQASTSVPVFARCQPPLETQICPKHRVCSYCKKIVPCACRLDPTQEPFTPQPSSELYKLSPQNEAGTTNTNSSCCTCRKDDSEIEDAIFKWLKDLPVYADESSANKKKREEMIRDLAAKLKNLEDVRNYDEKAKVEIKKCVEKLPMWYPGVKRDQEAFKNLLIVDLLNRFASVAKQMEENDDLKNVISQWLDQVKSKVDKDNIRDNIVKRLKPLIDTCDDLETEIKDILQECAISNKTKVIDQLAKELSDILTGRTVKNQNNEKRDSSDSSDSGQMNERRYSTDSTDNELERKIMELMEDIPGLSCNTKENKNMIRKLAKKLRKAQEQGLDDEETQDQMKEVLDWINSILKDNGLKLDSKTKLALLNKLLDNITSTATYNSKRKAKQSSLKDQTINEDPIPNMEDVKKREAQKLTGAANFESKSKDEKSSLGEQTKDEDPISNKEDGKKTKVLGKDETLEDAIRSEISDLLGFKDIFKELPISNKTKVIDQLVKELTDILTGETDKNKNNEKGDSSDSSESEPLNERRHGTDSSYNELERKIMELMEDIPGLSYNNKENKNMIRKLAKKLRKAQEQGLDDEETQDQMKEVLDWINSILKDNGLKLDSKTKLSLSNKLLDNITSAETYNSKRKNKQSSLKDQTINEDPIPNMEDVKKREAQKLTNAANFESKSKDEISSLGEQTKDEDPISNMEDVKKREAQKLTSAANFESKSKDEISSLGEQTKDEDPISNKEDGKKTKVLGKDETLEDAIKSEISDLLGLKDIFKELPLSNKTKVIDQLVKELTDILTGETVKNQKNENRDSSDSSDSEQINEQRLSTDSSVNELEQKIMELMENIPGLSYNNKENKNMIRKLAKKLRKAQEQGLDDEETQDQIKEVLDWINSILKDNGLKLDSKTKLALSNKLLNNITSAETYDSKRKDKQSSLKDQTINEDLIPNLVDVTKREAQMLTGAANFESKSKDEKSSLGEQTKDEDPISNKVNGKKPRVLGKDETLEDSIRSEISDLLEIKNILQELPISNKTKVIDQLVKELTDILTGETVKNQKNEIRDSSDSSDSEQINEQRLSTDSTYNELERKIMELMEDIPGLSYNNKENKNMIRKLAKKLRKAQEQGLDDEETQDQMKEVFDWINSILKDNGLTLDSKTKLALSNKLLDNITSAETYDSKIKDKQSSLKDQNINKDPISNLVDVTKREAQKLTGAANFESKSKDEKTSLGEQTKDEDPISKLEDGKTPKVLGKDKQSSLRDQTINKDPIPNLVNVTKREAQKLTGAANFESKSKDEKSSLGEQTKDENPISNKVDGKKPKVLSKDETSEDAIRSEISDLLEIKDILQELPISNKTKVIDQLVKELTNILTGETVENQNNENRDSSDSSDSEQINEQRLSTDSTYNELERKIMELMEDIPGLSYNTKENKNMIRKLAKKLRKAQEQGLDDEETQDQMKEVVDWINSILKNNGLKLDSKTKSALLNKLLDNITSAETYDSKRKDKLSSLKDQNITEDPIPNLEDVKKREAQKLTSAAKFESKSKDIKSFSGEQTKDDDPISNLEDVKNREAQKLNSATKFESRRKDKNSSVGEQTKDEDPISNLEDLKKREAQKLNKFESRSKDKNSSLGEQTKDDDRISNLEDVKNREAQKLNKFESRNKDKNSYLGEQTKDEDPISNLEDVKKREAQKLISAAKIVSKSKERKSSVGEQTKDEDPISNLEDVKQREAQKLTSAAQFESKSKDRKSILGEQTKDDDSISNLEDVKIREAQKLYSSAKFESRSKDKKSSLGEQTKDEYPISNLEDVKKREAQKLTSAAKFESKSKDIKSFLGEQTKDDDPISNLEDVKNREARKLNSAAKFESRSKDRKSFLGEQTKDDDPIFNLEDVKQRKAQKLTSPANFESKSKNRKSSFGEQTKGEDPISNLEDVKKREAQKLTSAAKFVSKSKDRKSTLGEQTKNEDPIPNVEDGKKWKVLGKDEPLKDAIRSQISDLFEKIPNVSQSKREQIRDKIVGILSNNMDKLPDKNSDINREIVKKEGKIPIDMASDLASTHNNKVKEMPLPGVSKSSVLQPTKTDDIIKKLVSQVVSKTLNDYNIPDKIKKEFEKSIEEVLADQIMRGTDSKRTKDKTMSILEGAHLSENDASDISSRLQDQNRKLSLSYNTQHSKSMSPMERENFMEKAKREILDFIEHLTGDYSMQMRKKRIEEAKELVYKLGELMSDPNEIDKEKGIIKEVTPYLQGILKNTDVLVEEEAKKLASRIQNIGSQASTPKREGSWFNPKRDTPEISSIRIDDDDSAKTFAQVNGDAGNHYINELTELITAWMDELPVDFSTTEDKDFQKTMINDLVGDIIDRQKYLQLNPDAKTSNGEDIEHLKYQVFKWLNKLPDISDMSPIMQLTEALTRKVKAINVPELVKPPKKRTDDSIKETISKWIDETIDNLYLSRPSDQNFQKKMIEDLAEKIQQYRSNNELNNIDKDISNWLVKLVKDIDNEELNKLLESLKAHLQLVEFTKDNILSQDNSQFVEENLVGGIRDLLKSLPLYLKSNEAEKREQEQILSKLVKDLKLVLENSSTTDSDKLTTKEIMNHVKKFPMNVELNSDELFIQRLAAQLLQYIKDLQLFHNISERQDISFDKYLKAVIEDWFKSLPLPTEISKIENDKKEFIEKVKQIRQKDPTNEQNLKDEIRNYLQKSIHDNMKQNTKFINEKVEELFKTLLTVPINTTVPYGSDKFIEDAVGNWLKLLPLEDGKTVNDIPIYAVEELRSAIANLNEKADIIIRQNSNNRMILEDAIEKFLKTAPLDPNATIDVKLLAEALLMDMKKMSGKLPTIAMESLIKPLTVKKAADILFENIEKWCDNLPIKADTPEEIENAKKIKQEIASKLIHKIGELNMNPDVFNDDFLYDDMLEDEIDNLLTDLFSEDFKKNITALKKDLMQKVKEARKKTQEEVAGQTYKQQLREAISKTLPFQSQTQEEIADFEILKDNLADAFINLHYVGGDEIQKNKYKAKIGDEVSKFCNDYLKKHPGSPIDTEKLNKDLYKALKSIPVPKEETIRDEVELVKIKDEINEWVKNLPMSQTPEERIQAIKLIAILAKKLHDIQKQKELDPNTDYDDKIRKEIMKWIKKPPFNIDDAKASKLFDKLINKLKNTEKSRRVSASTRHSIDADLFDKIPAAELAKTYQIKQYVVPPTTLSTEEQSHLQQIRKRSSTSQPRYLPSKDASVSPLPVDAGSQTEVTPVVSQPTSEKRLSKQSSEVQTQKPPEQKTVQAVGSQAEVTPHVIVREYYWDTLDGSQMAGVPSPCQFPTQGCMGSQMAAYPRTLAPSPSLSAAPPGYIAPQRTGYPNQMAPCPGLSTPKMTEQSPRPLDQDSSQTPSPCYPGPVRCPYLSPRSSVPDSQAPTPQPRRPRKEWQPPCYRREIPEINSDDYPEPGTSKPCKSSKPRVTRLGSFDKMEPKTTLSRTDWKFPEDDEFWGDKRTLGSDDDGVPLLKERKKEEEKVRCRCRETIMTKCAGRRKIRGCESTANVKKCSKCCGIHCPYPSSMYFR